MDIKKPSIDKGFITSIIIILAVIVYLYSKQSLPDNNILQVPFPLPANVTGNISFACESLMSSNIISDSSKLLAEGIEGQLSKGTDKIAMNIKGPSILNFITGASVQAGISEGDNFTILENNEEKLLAVWANENVISTIVLNKQNGLAIWLKGTPNFPLYEAPSGQIIYLICR
jgi:hypothetical protein